MHRIAYQRLSTVAIIPLAGDLSVNTITAMRKYLQTLRQDHGLTGYVFDLSQLKHMDSARTDLMIELTQWY